MFLSLSLSKKTQVYKKNIYLQGSSGKFTVRERERAMSLRWNKTACRLHILSLLYKIDKHCVIEFSRWFFAHEYLSIASFWLRHTGALTLYGLKRLLLKLQNQHFIIRIFWFIPRMSAFTTNVSWATVFHVLKIDGRPFLLW